MYCGRYEFPQLPDDFEEAELGKLMIWKLNRRYREEDNATRLNSTLVAQIEADMSTPIACTEESGSCLTSAVRSMLKDYNNRKFNMAVIDLTRDEGHPVFAESNPRPHRDFRAFLMFHHARVYFLADRLGITPLKYLASVWVHKTLKQDDLISSEALAYLPDFVAEIYANTTPRDVRLRSTVVHVIQDFYMPVDGFWDFMKPWVGNAPDLGADLYSRAQDKETEKQKKTSGQRPGNNSGHFHDNDSDFRPASSESSDSD
jgi:hypothetical protein